jgi:hypothetical protein
VGLASKVTWGQRLVSRGGSSRPCGLSVNGWLGKADLGLALCGSGKLIVQPRVASTTRYWSVNVV